MEVHGLIKNIGCEEDGNPPHLGCGKTGFDPPAPDFNNAMQRK